MRLLVAGMESSDRLSGPRVQPQPPRRRQLVVEGVPHEGMREAQPARGPRDLAHGAGFQRLVEHLERLARLAVGHSRQGVDRELAPEHAGRCQSLAALLGKPPDAAPDYVADALRDAHARRRAVLECSLRDQQPRHLVDEECVSLRLGVNRRDGRRVRREASGQMDVLADVRLVETAKRDPPHRRLARQLGQRRGERIAKGRVDVPVGANDEQAAVSQPACDELEEQQRGLVGGVQIVEREHERPLCGGAREKREHGVEEAEASRLRVERRRLRQIAKELAQFRQQLCHLASAGTELLTKALGIALTDVGPKRLHPGPVGGGTARLPTSADQNVCGARPSVEDKLFGEAAFSDAGLTDEEEEVATAGTRVLEAREELSQLRRTADEDASRRLGRLLDHALDRARQIERAVLP
jgi:hypothetical protein